MNELVLVAYNWSMYEGSNTFRRVVKLIKRKVKRSGVGERAKSRI